MNESQPHIYHLLYRFPQVTLPLLQITTSLISSPTKPPYQFTNAPTSYIHLQSTQAIKSLLLNKDQQVSHFYYFFICLLYILGAHNSTPLPALLPPSTKVFRISKTLSLFPMYNITYMNVLIIRILSKLT